MLVSLSFLFVGCAATKGTMFDGRVCTFATSAGANQLKEQILATYTSNDQKVRTNAVVGQMGVTALCEILRDREANAPKEVNLEIK
jgi:hypothetical protein